jgi:drug/metabolite transporter (DMT)-like permease
VLLFGERLNWQAILGMTLVVIGVAVLVSSGSVRHG